MRIVRSGRTALGVIVIAASTGFAASLATRGDDEAADSIEAQVLRGRALTLVMDCGACHGGTVNPAADGWLAGRSEEIWAETIGEFVIFPKNLTPDDATGIGRYTERQIFNALRYGLRPSETPDVDITSLTPGQGNHPANPVYLSPAMPWAAWRHMTDQELRDIAAYLKRGLLPVSHRVPDSGWPDDGWAAASSTAAIGAYPAPPFPTALERAPAVANPVAAAPGPGGPVTLDRLLRGRELVIAHACGACHGMAYEPSMDGWLVGMRAPENAFPVGPFMTRPRNITPDNLTGIGRFSERQLFNALRFGLRPGETPDVVITSTVPGQGNHPLHPKYLAPPMPWPAFRHRADQDLWDIVAYLKHGVLPVSNHVPDSDGPPDFWASTYAGEEYAGFPVPAFPTAAERALDRSR